MGTHNNTMRRVNVRLQSTNDVILNFKLHLNENDSALQDESRVVFYLLIFI